LVKQLYEKLLDQLYCAFQYHYQFTNNEGKDYEKQIKKISLEIFAAIPEIRRLMSLDVRAALKGDPAALSYHEIILSYPFIKTITVHRLAHILYNAQVPIIPRMMNEWAHTKTGIDIHPGAKIGESFFIDHGTGVVIGETTEIGNNVKLYQGVTLGALSFKKDGQGNIIKGRKRHPTLKDNVVVYANATILGGQTVIGSNCIIGGNTWIIKSIEDNTIVTIDKPTLVYRKINDK
jgi:serine O-acetyltransferase